MNDGHVGIKNTKLKEYEVQPCFQVALAYLDQGKGHGNLVLHVTCNENYSLYELDPQQFLSRVGFNLYTDCIFHHERCYYIVIGKVTLSKNCFYEIDSMQSFDIILPQVEKFVQNLDKLYQLHNMEKEILELIGLDKTEKIIFGPPIEINISDEIPLWVNDVKFPRLIELETQKAPVQKEIEELISFLPLLYEDGEILKFSVIKALQMLGLDAKRIKTGFTADVLAQTPDGTKKFGFEITGSSEPIKNSSNKLAQVLDFERIKEHGEKTVLIANTHRTTSISERKNLEDFTKSALNFLNPFPILLMTSWDLYCMIHDVLQGSRKKEEIIEILYTTNGKLNYSPVNKLML